MNRPRLCVFSILAVSALAAESLDVRADEFPRIERVLPPPGIKLADADHARLAEGVDKLKRRLTELAERHRKEVTLGDADEADASIYLKAVDFALKHNEFYQPRDVELATELLQTAHARLDDLALGRRPWREARGLVVRGYRSQLDGSYQPYGLVIPDKLDLKKPVPLYVWLHGRGDKTTDLHFIAQRQKSKGQVAPPDAIVLHPFGRYCNAFKFAGEVDVFEAIRAVGRSYHIDRDRVVLWGFSMGGAGTWHLGAHYPGRFVAISPGAGFAETRRYQNLQPQDYPPAHERTLWHLYDVPSYTRNLFNLPVVAYSGERDKQIQAARIMEEAFQQHGRKLQHIIGPGMGHAYHPQSLQEIGRLMREHVERGLDRWPKTVSLQTRTLRYNHCHWVRVERLEQHWLDSRVDAEAVDDKTIRVTTRNITRLVLLPPWRGKGNGTEKGIDKFAGGERAEIDGTALVIRAGRQYESFDKQEGRWTLSDLKSSLPKRQKIPELQGPIDDAFMDPFLVVPPDRPCANLAVDQWVRFELAHFLDRWRELFRGEARVKQAKDVTPDDLGKYNLVLWGDPAGNSLIDRVLREQGEFRLPLSWDKSRLALGDQGYDAAHHVPAMIYRNPLVDGGRYVVLNSGPTFREGHDRTNSLQTPKLPDWALIDVRTPPDTFQPGKVVAAGFFDENWDLRPQSKDNHR